MRAEPSPEAVAAAHARLLGDRTIQFEFPPPEPPPRPPPGWLADLLTGLAPFLEVVFWAGVAALGAAVAFFIGREILQLRPGRPKRKAKPETPLDLRPAPSRALALLKDADALAAEGRYAEAAHLLLLRSVADIEARRPNTIHVSFTSREIAALPALPAPARSAFSLIAAAVERSLFGGREVDASAWAECRRAYEGFALPQGWA